MSAPSAAILAIFLSASASGTALPPVPEPEDGSLPGLTLSLGSGRPTCGRVTFDRRKAAAGGFIFMPGMSAI